MSENATLKLLMRLPGASQNSACWAITLIRRTSGLFADPHHAFAEIVQSSGEQQSCVASVPSAGRRNSSVGHPPRAKKRHRVQLFLFRGLTSNCLGSTLPE